MSDTVERVIPGDLTWRQYGLEHIQRYEYFCDYYKNKKVLDAACGTGYGSSYIHSCGASAVTGIDISDEALSFATKNYNAPGLSYRKKDCSDLSNLGERFDVIISFETIEHLKNPLEFIESAAKALNDGGTFICSTPNKARLSGAGHINPFHLHELTWEEFKAGMEKHFHINACLHQTETLPYLRYMELKFEISKAEGRASWNLFHRLENKIRNAMGRPTKKELFMHPELDFLHEGDMEIKPLLQAENWHKTFIIAGTKKQVA